MNMLTRRNLKKNKQTLRVQSLDGQFLNVPTPDYANNSHTCPRFNRLSLDFTLHASITSLAGSNNSISASSQEGSREGEKLKLPPVTVGSVSPRSGSPDMPDSPKSWRVDRSPLPVRKVRCDNLRGWGSCPSLLDDETIKFAKEKEGFQFPVNNYGRKLRDYSFDKSSESVFYDASVGEQDRNAKSLIPSVRQFDSRSDSPQSGNILRGKATSEEPQIVVDLEGVESCYETEDIYDEDLVDATEKCMYWLKGLEASRNSDDGSNSPPRVYRKLNTRLSSSMEAIVDY